MEFSRLGKAIEIYVRKREVQTYSQVFAQVDPGHACADWHGTSGTAPTVAPTKKRVLREDDKCALDIARAIAKERRLKLEVYDLSTLSGRLRSRLKSIHKTPTIMIGNERISERITRKRLLDALE